MNETWDEFIIITKKIDIDEMDDTIIYQIIFLFPPVYSLLIVGNWITSHVTNFEVLYTWI